MRGLSGSDAGVPRRLRGRGDSHRIENIIRPGDYGIAKIIPSANQHPTEKPVELAEHFIKLHTAPGDIVLDPFCGSGTTAVACVRTGRRFIGIELDEKYCKIARERVEAARKGLTIQEIRTGQEVLFGGNDE